MFNPWMKKNPFMSLWLSMAHQMVGSFLGQATAQASRQIRSATSAALSEAITPRSATVMVPAARKRRSRRR